MNYVSCESEKLTDMAAFDCRKGLQPRYPDSPKYMAAYAEEYEREQIADKKTEAQE